MSSDVNRPDRAMATREDLADPVEPLLAFADALLSSGERDMGRAAGEVQQYVTFFLRDDEIGIPILQCREIVRAPAITRVPEAPDHVRGVVNLRGRIIPAIDTRKCLGYESAPPTARSRLLVVDVAGRSFALLVDRIVRILKLAAADIAPPPENAPVRAILGVASDGEKKIYITDAETILLPKLASAVPTSRSEEA